MAAVGLFFLVVWFCLFATVGQSLSGPTRWPFRIALVTTVALVGVLTFFAVMTSPTRENMWETARALVLPALLWTVPPTLLAWGISWFSCWTPAKPPTPESPESIDKPRS